MYRKTETDEIDIMEASGNEPLYPKQGGEFRRVLAVTASMAGGLGDCVRVAWLVLRAMHMGGLMLRAIAGAVLALDGGYLTPARDGAERGRYQHLLQAESGNTKADGWAGVVLVATFVAVVIALFAAGVGGFTGCCDERKPL
ncbi:hypothetical protein C8J57DRAFT_1524222 [Mycena rebaudengoi]|nr:hypothetical protein C8J57DRAFT_1524222 [Mycena rebaudengoi]